MATSWQPTAGDERLRVALDTQDPGANAGQNGVGYAVPGGSRFPSLTAVTRVQIPLGSQQHRKPFFFEQSEEEGFSLGCFG